MSVDPFDTLSQEAANPDPLTPQPAPVSHPRSGPGGPAAGRSVPLHGLARNPKLLLGGIIFLAIALLYFGVMVLERLSSALPIFGATPEPPAPTATALPQPTATSMPAVATLPPSATLAAAQLTVDGPGTYQGAQPYLAEYRVELPRGDGIKGRLVCRGCLWPQGIAPTIDLPGAKSSFTFRVAVIPPEPAHFSLTIADRECLSWDLKQAAQAEPFQASCAP